MVFELKKSNTSPDIKFRLEDGNGNPVPLPSGTQVQFRMDQRGQSVIDAQGEVLDGSDGIVKYEWQDTSTLNGTFNAEWEITFPDGETETFPNDDFIRVLVIDDLT